MTTRLPSRPRNQVTFFQALALLDPALRLVEPGELDAACRVCACTNLRACVGGCEWVATDLCSACAGPPAA